MFEMVGMLIALFVVGLFAFFLSLIVGGVAWLLFWRRRRPKRLIFIAASIPPLSLGYLIVCAILFTIFVPNQPDLFFGDFSEPLPHGYLLSGLGKMPEYANIETEPGEIRPELLGGIKSLEEDGEIIYGAYSHPDYAPSGFFAPTDIGYFELSTRSGQVRNFKTIQELNASAGHPVHQVESQFFRSQLSSRIWLRRVENGILYLPPLAVFLYLACRIAYLRIKGMSETEVVSGWPAGGLGLSR